MDVLEMMTQPVTAGRIRHCGDTRISEFHQREGEEVSGHQLGEWVLRQHPKLLMASARAQRHLEKLEAQWLVMDRILA